MKDGSCGFACGMHFCSCCSCTQHDSAVDARPGPAGAATALLRRSLPRLVMASAQR